MGIIIVHYRVTVRIKVMCAKSGGKAGHVDPSIGRRWISNGNYK